MLKFNSSFINMLFPAILGSSLVWFVLAGVLFFNPVVDKIYRKEESVAGVRSLPKSPKTIGMILGAILIQTIIWALVFVLIAPALPADKLNKGLLFGLILILTKMIPRDIDRMLLTTYPKKRMIIEFIIGCVCCLAVGITFGFLL